MTHTDLVVEVAWRGAGELVDLGLLDDEARAADPRRRIARTTATPAAMSASVTKSVGPALRADRAHVVASRGRRAPRHRRALRHAAVSQSFAHRVVLQLLDGHNRDGSRASVPAAARGAGRRARSGRTACCIEGSRARSAARELEAELAAPRARGARPASSPRPRWRHSGHPGGSFSSMEIYIVLYCCARLRPGRAALAAAATASS